MNIEEQKKIADRVLKDIEVIDPNAIIAGGAPRDWALGETAKDIDIYFYSHANCTQTISSIAKLTGIQTELLGSSEHSEAYKNIGCLVRVLEGCVNGLKIQFMQLQGPNDVYAIVDKFSTSICKAYRYGKVSMFHEDFLITLSTGYMFLTDGYKWSDKHPAKMADRFKGRFKAGTLKHALISGLEEPLKRVKAQYGLRGYGFNGAACD